MHLDFDDTEQTMKAMNALLVIIALVVLYLLVSIRILRQYERGVVFVLGKFGGTSSQPSEDWTVEFGLKLIKEFPSAWRMLDPGELRILRELFFPENLVYGKTGFQTRKLAPIYKLKSEEDTSKTHQVTSLLGFPNSDNTEPPSV